MDARPIHVLLVEDNPADAALTKRAFQRNKLAVSLQVVTDGEAALEAVVRDKPDVVLLDLNLPRVPGHQVLQRIKADPRSRHIPVVVLSSSEAQRDIARSYDLQAAAYLIKPVDLEQLSDLVQAIDTFWFTVVRYPS